MKAPARSRAPGLALLFCFFFSAPVFGPRESAQPAAPLAFELGAGPLLGLDRPLRGGSLQAAAFLDLGTIFGPGFSGLEPGLRALALYDLEFHVLAAGADLVLGLGPELRLSLGLELPLTTPRLESAGELLPLRAAAWPNHFTLSALLVNWEAAGYRGPDLALESVFGWSSYAFAPGLAASAREAVQSGIRGFASGFRLGTLLRLRWATRAEGP